MNGRNAVGILLVDDHPFVREGVRARLEAVAEFRVVAEAANGLEGLDLALMHAPSLLLTDIGMHGMTGLQLAERCRQRLPATAVIVLSMHGGLDYFERAFRAGARGYVLKHAPAEELVTAIRTVMAGGCHFSPELMRERVGESDAPPDRLHRLTARERFILAGLARGLSNRDIADELRISASTVESYRFSLKRKLDISGQAALVKFALESMPRLAREAPLLGPMDQRCPERGDAVVSGWRRP